MEDPARGQEKTNVPSQIGGLREQTLSSFCSVQTLSGWDDALPLWGGQSALLGLLIQMFILFRNTLIDTPRNNSSPDSWTSHGPVKWTHKLSQVL